MASYERATSVTIEAPRPWCAPPFGFVNTKVMCGVLSCAEARDTSFMNQSIYLLVKIPVRRDKKEVDVSPAGDTLMGNDVIVVLGSRRVCLH